MPNASPAQDKPGLIYTLPGVLLLVAAYALVHIAARLGASSNLGEDDPLDNLLIQTLAWGYSPTQPPLYDWLLWGLQQGLGAGVHAFLVLKYAMLVALAGFLFLITRRLTHSPFWALMAVDAMALTYQIFWRFHEGFTHRVGAMTLALATVWALLRLLDRSRWQDYALFGLLAGLGLLTEPSYGLLLLALLLAGLLQPAARVTVLAPGMLLSLLIALVVIAPYGLWLLAEPGRLAAFQAGVLPWPKTYSLGAGLAAIGNALTTPVLVLSPYIFILPLVFPGVLRTLLRQTPVRPLAHAAPDARQLLLHVLLIQFALLAVGGLLQQRTHYAVHSLLPMFVVAIAWLTAKVQEAAPSARRIRVFVAFSLVITVIALLGRVANMYVLEPVCSICRWGTPYAELAQQMRATGFERGTVLTTELELGGNLRRFFPDDRFVVPATGHLPPETAYSRGGQVAIVWNAKADPATVLAQLRPYLPPGLEPFPEPRVIEVPWPHLWKPEGYRYSTWRLMLLAPASSAGPGR